MNIKLTELEHRKGEPLPFQLTLDATELKKRHHEIRGITPVEAKGEAVQLGNLYYVKGDLKADVDFICARCLNPFTHHASVAFSETFAPEDDPILREDEDSDILPLEGDEIQLDSLLQEDFLLAMPIFPLCEEDCKGLCPTCGVNRNEVACICTNERIDPRLAGLADLFKDSNK
ncbi:YceD family protein [Brevibacillus choshinensis]|uniref:YceD family protein n=1 Tax=Brevibacillus choshinensis TaxID=54911 RepID=UPI002E1D549F|nr:YceD family protein [Brevibacillus choshinensis]